MSLLFNGSYANPAQSLWVPVSGTGGGGGGSDYPVYDSSGALIGGLVAGDMSGNLVVPVGLQGNRIAFTQPGVVPNTGLLTYNSFFDISSASIGDSGDFFSVDGTIRANHLVTQTGRMAGSTAIPGGVGSVNISQVPYVTSNSFIFLSHVKRSPTDRPVGNLAYNAYDISSNTFTVYTTDMSGVPITSPDNVRFNWFIVNNLTDIIPPYN